VPRRDQGPYDRAYYQRNREDEIARVRVRQDATRDLLRTLRERPCAECGGSFRPYQMDFDHRDPADKSFRITSGRAMLAPLPRLIAEVDKCDVVCANCHRLRTWRQGPVTARRSVPASKSLERKRASWRAHAAMLDAIKLRPCADCGSTFPPCAMDFDHRSPATKRTAVSRMIGRAGMASILAEVAKCDIVCANCHRERTFRRRVASSGRE
jgi:hypothetical protein